MLGDVTFTINQDIVNVDFNVEQKAMSVTIIEASGGNNTASTTVIDNLTSASGLAALSANQGLVLKGLIDGINTILNSDDTTLDEFQEIVSFIKQNKTTLDALGISNIAGLVDALAGKVNNYQVLTDVPLNALFTDTVYTHPTNHLPSIISQNAENRFVSDSEKTNWNNKIDKSETVVAFWRGSQTLYDSKSQSFKDDDTIIKFINE